jgi:CRISPR-associated protein (Cas_Csm6).
MNRRGEEVCDIRKGVKMWNMDKLKKNNIFDILNNAYIKKGGIKEGPVYSHALAHIIRAKSNDDILKSKVDEIVDVEQNIRNLAAHQIVSVTDKWFVDKSGKSPEEIMNIIRYLFVQAGVGAKNDDWNTYDVMNDPIITY